MSAEVIELHDPSLLTPARQTAMITSIRSGSSIATAAKSASVYPRTVENWIRWGKDELKVDPLSDRKCAKFVLAVDKARAEFEQDCIKVVVEAAPKTWQAAAWLLERKFPDQYAKVDRTKTSNEEESDKKQIAQSREEGQRKLIEKLARLSEKLADRVPVDEVEAEVIEDNHDDS